MRGKIENLGDYNTARIMIQEMNGDLSALIKKWKNRGAFEALPKQFGLGLLIGAPVWLGGKYAIKKVADYIEKRKNEKKEELDEELKAELLAGEEAILFKEDEESPC